jgi:hypothetical protein
MFSYEIKTFGRECRPILAISVECSDDFAAILLGRELALGGKALEVRRDGALVYRVGLGRQLQDNLAPMLRKVRRSHWEIISRFLPGAQPSLSDIGR